MRNGNIILISLLISALVFSPSVPFSGDTTGISDRPPVLQEGLAPPNVTVEMARYHINSTFFPPMDPAEELVEGRVTCEIPARAKPDVRCMVTIYPRMTTDQVFDIDPLYFTRNDTQKSFSFMVEAQIEWMGDSVRYMNLDIDWYYEGARGTGPVNTDPIEINVLPVVLIDVEEKTKSPHTVEAGKMKEIPIEIKNGGNALAKITLTAEIDDDSVDVQFSDNDIYFEPRKIKDVIVRVQTDEDTPSESITFNVVASSESYGGSTSYGQEITVKVQKRDEGNYILPIISAVLVALGIILITILLISIRRRR